MPRYKGGLKQRAKTSKRPLTKRRKATGDLLKVTQEYWRTTGTNDAWRLPNDLIIIGSRPQRPRRKLKRHGTLSGTLKPMSEITSCDHRIDGSLPRMHVAAEMSHRIERPQPILPASDPGDEFLWMVLLNGVPQ